MATVQAFDHITERFRGKVATDFLAHVSGDGKWDETKFDPHNDYQRHLYALFLKSAGIAQAEIWAKLYVIADDVEQRQRGRYIDDILHSEIVGFSRSDGSLLAMPTNQMEVL